MSANSFVLNYLANKGDFKATRLFADSSDDPTLMQDLPPPDKLVTFFNTGKEKIARYSGKLLEPPLSVPIQLMDTGDGFVNTSIIEATDKKFTSPIRGSSQREDESAYAEALAMSRTFVVADSFFTESSMLVDSESFLKYGLEPLREFYQNGGRVVVMCVEGIYSIGDILESAFGCEWRLGKIVSESCIPTRKGTEILGSDAKEVYAGKGHMMVVPEDERLYTLKVVDEKEYMSDYYGLMPDEVCDEDELSEAKRCFERYVDENSNNSLLALHENENGGSVVWVGDRNEEDTKMRAIFAKLCCG